MLMRRASLFFAAVGLTLAAVAAGTVRADAAPTDWPSGMRAPKTHGVFTYYLDPGHMIAGKPYRATFDGKEANLRKDGIFYLVLGRPSMGHWMHVKIFTRDEGVSDRWSSWIKFEKPRP